MLSNLGVFQAQIPLELLTYLILRLSMVNIVNEGLS